MESSAHLTRALVLLILVAALVSAPFFLVAEGFHLEHVWRVAASNGVCAIYCVGLLGLLRRGRTQLAGSLLVYGLLAIVSTLAWFNGESVHVNVVNFVLVTVLAGTLLKRRDLVWISVLAAVVMVGIAMRQDIDPSYPDPWEARMESIVQFLPTYVVVVGVLWLRAEGTSKDLDRG